METRASVDGNLTLTLPDFPEDPVLARPLDLDGVVERVGGVLGGRAHRHEAAVDLRVRGFARLHPQEEGGWSPRSLSMLRKYSHGKTPEERGHVTPLAALGGRRTI